MVIYKIKNLNFKIMKNNRSIIVAAIFLFLNVQFIVAANYLKNWDNHTIEAFLFNTPPPPSHLAWNSILSYAVSEDGKVDYSKMKAKKADLAAYIQTLSENTPTDQWTRNEKLVYWINAYNALTVQLIVTNYPVKSIKDLDGGKTWDVKRYTLGGKKYSLNDIENNIIRPMGEPRIHFAVNCAAKSCPPLLNRAFIAYKLDAQLESQAKKFVNNTQLNNIKAGEAKVSNIFNWYKEDFSGGITTFLNKYSTTKLTAKAKISFMDYDWGLNE